MLDEWHQSFLPSRTGTFRDAILDGTAGLVAQIALFAILRKQRLAFKDGKIPLGAEQAAQGRGLNCDNAVFTNWISPTGPRA